MLNQSENSWIHDDQNEYEDSLQTVPNVRQKEDDAIGMNECKRIDTPRNASQYE